METIYNLTSDVTVENIMRIITTAGIFFILMQVRTILRRIRLSEFKHVATIHALSKSIGNGFIDHYREKLESLIEEYNFKSGK